MIVDTIALRANIEYFNRPESGLSLKPRGRFWKTDFYLHEQPWPLIYTAIHKRGEILLPEHVPNLTTIFSIISDLKPNSYPQSSWFLDRTGPLFLDKENWIKLMHNLGLLKNDPYLLRGENFRESQ